MQEDIIIENQPILNKILNNINKNGSKVNAYLLVGDSNLLDYSILFSKVLICPSKYKKNCDECNICRRIDLGDFSELVVISPENGVIKKEKVVDLKKTFSTKTIESKTGVYIINDVETLNMSSSNSILKFLEEPDDNIVAIFNTTNIDKVLPTIVSRCQVIKVNSIRKTYGIDFVKEVTNLEEEEIYDILSFIKKIELDYESSFALLKTDFINKFDTREKLKLAIKTIILYYKDVLNYKIKKQCIYFDINDLKRISEINDSDKISQKISFLLENIEKIEYNVNILLFMSNLLIGIGEIENDKSSRN